MVNEYIVDYHRSSSELTSRIHPVIFLWTPKWFVSPEYFLNIFSQTCISHHGCGNGSNFQIQDVEITGDYILNVSQKIKFVHFYFCSQQNSPSDSIINRHV